jgi:signal transduction histidine kinase/ActR/RegA family two-component response regulator
MKRIDHTPTSSPGLLDAVFRAAVFDASAQDAAEQVLELAARALHAPLAVLVIGEGEESVRRQRVDANADVAWVAHSLTLPAHVRATVAAADAARSPEPWLCGARGLFVAVPLRLSGTERIGTLAVADPCARETCDDEVRVLRGLADALAREYRLRAENALHRQREAHLASQKRVLGLIARGSSLDRVMRALAEHIERMAVASLCVIHTVREDGSLERMAAPTLPENLLALLDCERPHPDGGPAARALYRREPVVVEDLTAADAPSHDYYTAARDAGFGSCWSFPVLSRGHVYGAIDLHRMTKGRPGPADLQLIAVARSLARIAIERKRAEQSLRESDERLRQSHRMEVVGRLAGGVAHEFNNLLTVIGGSASQLREDVMSGEERRDALDGIQRATERASALTHQLLTFSQRQVLQPRPLDLNAVVRSANAMLRRLIGEDIRLDCQLQEGAAPIHADQGQLEQVIVNLAVNAREAMPDGGSLRIETSAVRIDDASARNSPIRPGRYVQLTVVDSGCGMNDAVLARIFEPFFTTHEMRTGLGLATVYGVVEQSGGHIEVHSAVGAGTRFDILFPQSASDLVSATVTPVAENGSRADHGSLLVVEDDPAVRALTTRLLARSGYTVKAAEDGQAAIELLRAEAFIPDLLLTDVVLPGMNGRQVADEVGRLVPGIPVLFMSGYTAEHLGQYGVLEDGVTLLHKPFDRATLLRTIREHLDRSGTPSHARTTVTGT